MKKMNVHTIRLDEEGGEEFVAHPEVAERLT